MKDISNILTANHKRETILSTNESQKQIKTLEELDMMDAFLFDKATASVENAITISKVIIKRATGLDVQNIVVETEKQIPGIDLNKRGVRFDVYLTEEYRKAGKNIFLSYTLLIFLNSVFLRFLLPLNLCHVQYSPFFQLANAPVHTA